jgi:hypothetical protein
VRREGGSTIIERLSAPVMILQQMVIWYYRRKAGSSIIEKLRTNNRIRVCTRRLIGDY